MKTITSLVIKILIDKRVPLKIKALPLLAVAYLLLPLDIIPDFIPIIGWLDDIIILLISIGVLLINGIPILQNNIDANGTKKSRQKPKVYEGEYRLIDEDSENTGY